MKLKINIDKARLQLLGSAVVNHIRKRTLKGLDKDGEAFVSYSTTPFAMPSGALTQKTRKGLDSASSLVWFTTNSGSKWVVIDGGYKELKAVKRPKDGGTVNLTDTGRMLQDLAVISTKKNQVQIGFNTSEQAQKALWNIENGRDFMGIEDKELSKLADTILGTGIEIELVE